MLCEVLLSKFHWFLIFLQSALPPIPIRIHRKSKRLYVPRFKLTHTLFLVCVIGTYIFVVIILLILVRLLLFVPRTSINYPTSIEGIFFFLYFCISIIILSVTQLIIVDGRSCVIILNRQFAMINEHKMKGNSYAQYVSFLQGRRFHFLFEIF